MVAVALVCACASHTGADPGTSETACALAFEGVGSYTTTKAIESCKFAFANDLHWNRDVRVEVVACPAGLTEVTGLIPASPNNFQGRTFDTYATTMEDCSLPSASRLGNTFDKGPWRPGYDAMYVSNLLGEQYTTEDAPLPTADAQGGHNWRSHQPVTTLSVGWGLRVTRFGSEAAPPLPRAARPSSLALFALGLLRAPLRDPAVELADAARGVTVLIRVLQPVAVE